ncbi:putative white-collar-1c protein [Mucor mucedo]|uniref:putative white-collar-1c protein n=1 Tax=Mucor mucedo TaxID=29922 RepID=UPI0022201F36|nr:putative white-collar-1c protein [Mucor mucedo]KAI7872621.1 putative white-collar-1c protein [Mucor mucedo]
MNPYQQHIVPSDASLDSKPFLYNEIQDTLLLGEYPLTDTTITPPVMNNNLTGVYSNTGFDMIQILSRLIHRPNPQIQLGPIDLSCSFVVSDAKQYDCPVVYCSPAFERLTGYTNSEIVGKNCRFLQSPDGQVTCGSRRQHTDNQAVYHLKAQLNQGKEHQASIINYRKGGQPFVNLVTVVPILGQDGTVDYFVGLQVDLVEQPNSILDKMKDGTYLINYHHQPMNTIMPTLQGNNNPLVDPSVDEYFRELPSSNNNNSNLNNNNGSTQMDIISLLDSTQIDFENLTTSEQQIQKEWNKVLLEQSCDFIHVLSLKGLFLYVSDSSLDMLEYEPEALVGTSLSSICHPSDIIPVMREIKEATTHPDKVINLLFRIRRKCSGYIWIDCRGKLHMDQSKGRKCLILSGRERPVYKLLNTVHISDNEYWGKLSLAGLFTHVTSTCKDVVGFSADSLENESLYQYVESNYVTELTRALERVKENQITKVRHTILNAKGAYASVQSTFYPGDTLHGIGQPSFVLLQMKLLQQDDHDDNNNSNNNSNSNSNSTGTDTCKDNLFSELETFRSTNWQYELHQLRQSNRRLREQLERYTNPNKQRKKKRVKLMDSPKMCAKCQRKDSPEWRKGPNGPKELCNACGLRYAKSLLSSKK